MIMFSFFPAPPRENLAFKNRSGKFSCRSAFRPTTAPDRATVVGLKADLQNNIEPFALNQIQEFE
jgi:hypothetical protein